MVRPIKLARDELVEFLPSQRAIKAFEAVFAETNELVDVDVPQAEIDGQSGIAIGGEAQGGVQEIRAQSLQVMVWLGI